MKPCISAEVNESDSFLVYFWGYKLYIGDLRSDILQTVIVEFDSMDQMTQVFGPFDRNIKLIEKTLPVTITGQGDRVKVTGEDVMAQKAARTLETLKKMRDNGQVVNDNVVSQAMELVDDGAADEALMVMKDVITLTYKGKPVKCKTIGQRNYINAIKEHAVTICIGPAGTGKTYLAIAMAVDALKKEEISRIILTRPAVEAGEHLGFLPGDLQSKVDPYLRPLYDGLFEMLGEESFNRNLERGIIEVAPLAYMRGRTLNNSFVILDEARNASLEQMFMVLTRLGEGSRIIVTGDVTQVDLLDKASGLERTAQILKDVDGIAVTKLSNRDVVRHKLVKDIIKAFEKYKEKEETRQRRKTDDTEHRRRNRYSRRSGL